MMIVHHEILPDSYLLILAADHADPSELELAHHLSCAARSDKPAVWVDCRLLDSLSLTAARLLLACHYRLQRRKAQLILCRVSERLEQILQQVGAHPAPTLCLVPTLDDAAEQTWHQMAC
jgi:anti-anti-sigma regulatory factor